MSEREFDAYLRLLGGLLRLAPEQREQIAGELRDHMEERLEALLAAGVPREEAIGQALEEFGDVAALAASFQQIAWNRKRRWMMRCTAASVCGMLVAILAVSALWPDAQPGSLLNNSLAQSTTQSTEDLTPTERNARARQQLTTHANIEFDGPLSGVAQVLRDNFGLPVDFDQSALDEAGIDINSTQVGLTLEAVRGHLLLELLLKQGNCGYFLRDGVVIITTENKAATNLAIQIYDCADLFEHDMTLTQVSATKGEDQLGAGGTYLPGVNPGDFNRQASLVELVVECTAAGENDGWLQLGTGAGSIMRYGDKLIISQSEAAHHEIAYLLQDLRQGLESHVSQTEFVHSEK